MHSPGVTFLSYIQIYWRHFIKTHLCSLWTAWAALRLSPRRRRSLSAGRRTRSGWLPREAVGLLEPPLESRSHPGLLLLCPRPPRPRPHQGWLGLQRVAREAAGSRWLLRSFTLLMVTMYLDLCTWVWFHSATLVYWLSWESSCTWFCTHPTSSNSGNLSRWSQCSCSAQLRPMPPFNATL